VPRSSLTDKEWLTVADVSAVLSRSPESIRNQIKKGVFKTVRQENGRYLIHRDEVIEIADRVMRAKHGTRETKTRFKNRPRLLRGES
jgi:hypothetical protein